MDAHTRATQRRGARPEASSQGHASGYRMKLPAEVQLHTALLLMLQWPIQHASQFFCAMKPESRMWLLLLCRDEGFPSQLPHQVLPDLLPQDESPALSSLLRDPPDAARFVQDLLRKLPPDVLDALLVDLYRAGQEAWAVDLQKNCSFQLEFLSEMQGRSVQLLFESLIPRKMTTDDLPALLSGLSDSTLRRILENLSPRVSSQIKPHVRPEPMDNTAVLREQVLLQAWQMEDAGSIHLFHGIPLSQQVDRVVRSELAKKQSEQQSPAQEVQPGALDRRMQLFMSLPHPAIHRVLREVDVRTLSQALSVTTPAVAERMLYNCPRRMAEQVRADLREPVGSMTVDAGRSVTQLVEIVARLKANGLLDGIR